MHDRKLTFLSLKIYIIHGVLQNKKMGFLPMLHNSNTSML